ncbi:MAG: class I SAM-dependent methyltransferase [bacterium]|nr:class I SAM-dependent methyltransferase [bacterium]
MGRATDSKALAESLQPLLVGPETHAPLEADGDALRDTKANRVYGRNEHGYFDFTTAAELTTFETTSDEYAQDQAEHKDRFYRDFLEPWLKREEAQRVLEVGTGLGMEISFMLDQGIDAYGVDIPCVSRFWAARDNDPAHFFACDGAAMPFPDGHFDAVFTLGVIEHIGTRAGHYTLSDDYRSARQAFASELLRVTRPGGRILVTCPNKAFPIDLAHEPTDAATPPGKGRIRRAIYDRTGMTLHLPFGTYHLLSYGEMRRLFRDDNGAQSVRPLPLRGYFTFNRFGAGPFGALKNVVASCVNNLPTPLLATPLNPFVIAEIRR